LHSRMGSWRRVVCAPPSRCRPRGGADRAEVVDVGRRRVVWEARLSSGVHCGVPLHELPPA
jgi:hypothetical protein